MTGFPPGWLHAGAVLCISVILDLCFASNAETNDYGGLDDLCSKLDSIPREDEVGLRASEVSRNPCEISFGHQGGHSSTLLVSFNCDEPIIAMAIQSRYVTSSYTEQSLGSWEIPGDVIAHSPCSDLHQNSVLLEQKTPSAPVALKWVSSVEHGDLQYMAFVRTASGDWFLRSGVINPFRSSRGRHKRDTQEENSTGTVPKQDDVSTWTDDVRTSTDDLATYATTTQDTSIDLMSYFNLVTIVGSYVVMYVIFAFLIL